MSKRSHQNLSQFAESRDESAFTAVVKEFSGLVFNSALRRTGDRELAEEVAQNVFAIAAKKAKRLAAHPALSGWFYTTTSLEASKAMRTRQQHSRRVEALARELESQTPTGMNTMTDAEQAHWQEALPVLDESLDRLKAADREIVLGRFFENRSFREIAASNGSTEAACKMRLKRALGKLNRWLTSRGATLSVAAISSGLTTEFAKGAPCGNTLLSSNAIAASSNLSLATILTNTMGTMSSIKSACIVIIALATVSSVPLVLQHSQASALKSRLLELQDRQVMGTSTAAANATQEQTNIGPAGQFLSQLGQPLDTDTLIIKMSAASMSRQQGAINRIMLPLAKLSNEEIRQLMADVEASEKDPLLKQITTQTLSSLMVVEAEESPGKSLDRNLQNGGARNLTEKMQVWAKEDPDAAFAWFASRMGEGKLHGKGAGDQREANLLAGLVAGLAHHDPDRAIALVDSIRDQEARNMAGQRMAGELTQRGADGRAKAAEWMARYDPQSRPWIASNVAGDMGRRGQLTEALEFARACQLSETGLTKTIGRIAATSTLKTWDEKVHWAMTNGSSSESTELIDELTNIGFEVHSNEEISQWIDTLAEGAARDAAMANEVSILMRTDDFERAQSQSGNDSLPYSSALQRAQQITSVEMREATIRKVFERASAKNTKAAEQLATAHGYELNDILTKK